MALTNNQRRHRADEEVAGDGPVNGLWARFVNMAIGTWLFLSAFLWSHSPSLRTNTWMCGLLVVGFAAWAMWANVARFLNTAVAIWLFFSTLSIAQAASFTLWNNVFCAVTVFVLSLIPTRTTATRRILTRRQAYP